MVEAVMPGNDIYSDTWAKAILSRDTAHREAGVKDYAE